MGKFDKAKGWLQKGIGKAMDMVPVVGPLLSAFGPTLIKGLGKYYKAVWGGIKKLFGGIGGPSEIEQQARDLFAGFHRSAVTELGGTQRFIDEVQVAIAAGWARTAAEARAAFILTATDAWPQLRSVPLSITDSIRMRSRMRIWASCGTSRRCMPTGAAAAKDDRADSATAAAAESTDDIADAYKGISGKIKDSLGGLTTQLDNVFRDRTIGVSYDMPDFGAGLDFEEYFERRQHGGPVSAGRPYMVGERGPEMFVPGQSGSVAANKSIPTAEEIGAAVAAALHRVPLVVPQDAVTDSHSSPHAEQAGAPGLGVE